MRPEAFLDPLRMCSSQPLTHRSRRDPERGGDSMLFPARFFELPGASPPSFAPVQPGFLGIHRPNIPLLYQPVQGSVSTRNGRMSGNNSLHWLGEIYSSYMGL